ncbi:MAG: rolling circle replication-associated protein [Phycisphaerae bacterium]
MEKENSTFALQSTVEPRQPVDGGGGAAAATAAGAAAAASLRLEYKGNNPTNGIDHRMVFLPCRCKSRMCSDCGPRLGIILRMRLLVVADSFRKPALLTLTVDRENFGSCQAAHTFVSSKGRIGLLMKRLGVKLWVWVLEFQQKTGDGWPHWHILVDLADCPGDKIDLKRAWNFWRNKWEIGGLDLQIKRRFHQPRHAIHYITKYLIKSPKYGYPRWVLESERTIRLVAACRKLGPLVSDGQSKPKSESDGERKPRGRRRLLVDRLAGCGQNTTAMRQDIDADNERVDTSFIGNVSASVEQLATMQQQGLLDSRIRLEDPVLDSKRDAVPVGVLQECHEAGELLDSVRMSVLDSGEYIKTQENVESRRTALLAAADQYGEAQAGESHG